MAPGYEHPDHDGATSDHDEIARVGALIKDIRVCMLTTVDEQERLTSRPMTTLPVEFDGDVWFFVSLGSQTVEQVRRDARVNLAYEDGSGWVSIAGDTDVVRDTERNEKLWNPFVEVYFPNGPNDPDVGLLRVHAHSAQYWDTPGKAAQVFAMVRARATSSRPDIGDTGTVEL